MLESLVEAERIGLASAILIGDPARIEAAAQAAGYELRAGNVVAARDEDEAIRVAIQLVRDGERRPADEGEGDDGESDPPRARPRDGPAGGPPA